MLYHTMPIHFNQINLPIYAHRICRLQGTCRPLIILLDIYRFASAQTKGGFCFDRNSGILVINRYDATVPTAWQQIRMLLDRYASSHKQRLATRLKAICVHQREYETLKPHCTDAYGNFRFVICLTIKHRSYY